MHQNYNWSTHIGRWFGVPTQVHMLLFLAVAAVFGAAWNAQIPNDHFFNGTAMVTVLALIVSVWLHELAHLFATNSLGGRVYSITLMPWGGLSKATLPSGSEAKLIANLAGPFVTGMVVLFSACLLAQNSQAPGFWAMVNPLEAHWFDNRDMLNSTIEIVCWVNFQLLILNLLPCYPFDGATILRSGLETAEVDMAPHRLEAAIKLVGHAVGFGVILAAFFSRNVDYPEVPGLDFGPPWVPLCLVGMALLFAASYSLHERLVVKEEELEEFPPFENEFQEAYFEFLEGEDQSHFAHSDPVSKGQSQWLLEKQAARQAETLLEIEASEEEQADQILDKLHERGIKSLSEEERLLLDRVSSRIRKRRQQGV